MWTLPLGGDYTNGADAEAFTSADHAVGKDIPYWCGGTPYTLWQICGAPDIKLRSRFGGQHNGYSCAAVMFEHAMVGMMLDASQISEVTSSLPVLKEVF